MLAIGGLDQHSGGNECFNNDIGDKSSNLEELT